MKKELTKNQEKFLERINMYCFSYFTSDKSEIIKFVEKNYTDEAMNIIYDLIGDGFKKYTNDNWEKVIDLAFDNEAVCSALFSNPEIPYKIMCQVKNFHNIYLQKEDVDKNGIDYIIANVKRNHLKGDILYDKKHISDTLLEALCHTSNKYQETIDYAHLSRIHNNVPFFQKIENELLDLYDGNELAMTAIANNPNFSEDTRNKAFENGCIMKNITNPTPKMIEDIYQSSADMIFEYSYIHYTELLGENYTKIKF